MKRFSVKIYIFKYSTTHEIFMKNGKNKELSLWERINRYLHKNYCPNCKQKVEPRRNYSWAAIIFGFLIVTILFGILWGIIFAAFLLFLDMISLVNKKCPICGCKYDRLEYRK